MTLRLACPWTFGGWSVLALLLAASAQGRPIAVDLTGFDPACGVEVESIDHPEGMRLRINWPISDGEAGRFVPGANANAPLFERMIAARPNQGNPAPLLQRGELVLDTSPDAPLFERMALARLGQAGLSPVLQQGEPAYFLTVGTREAPGGRPPTMSRFNTFFDSPADRPHQSFVAKRTTTGVRVVSQGKRVSVSFDGLHAGPFAGSLVVTVYSGAPLVHVEAVLSTNQDHCAYLYDTGLAGKAAFGKQLAWIDTEGAFHREPIDLDTDDRPLAVRHRTILVENDAGSVASFPPPHQYFFPRDLTDNLKTVWSGKNHRALEPRWGFGVRQAETGGGRFVPWFNAPPGTEQRLGVFYLLSRKPAVEAVDDVLRYTRGDRFAALPGHVTFSTHWHMATAVAAMREQVKGGPRTTPDLVQMFKDMNVQIVHLAEFHGDGHPSDPGPLRLPELEAMFAECRRLSDDQLLVLPGEEANVHLGKGEPGRHPGHWLCLFPGPVYWTLTRAPGQPFAETQAGRTLYHVGDTADVARLLDVEHGLAWTAHPRIKGSSWTPDDYRTDDFFTSKSWLGAAWKAMPADLSRPKLGERALDLLDDMANWGGKHVMPGEVDVFEIDHTHELFGHMNINYLQLDRAPRYDESWQPVLDALRSGRFFVTTGEVLIRDFRVGGRSSGEILETHSPAHPEVQATLQWTFPMRFADLVSGDGARVYHHQIDLSDTLPFAERTLKLNPDLTGRTWVRLDAWDVAGNGAFTQPIWLDPSPQ